MIIIIFLALVMLLCSFHIGTNVVEFFDNVDNPKVGAIHFLLAFLNFIIVMVSSKFLIIALDVVGM